MLKPEVREKHILQFRALESEFIVISYLLSHSDCVCHLKSEWFTHIHLKRITKVFLKLRTTLSEDTLIHNLQKMGLFPKNDKANFDVTMQELYETDSDISIDSFMQECETLQDKYFQRLYVGVCFDILEDRFSKGTKTARVKLENVLRDSSESLGSSQIINAVTDFPKRLEYQTNKEPEDNESDFINIPTSLDFLNATINGGLRTSDIGMMIAGSGVGKTTALLDFACHAWETGLYNVMVVSGEMDLSSLTHRLDARISGVSSEKYITKKLTESDISQWKNAIKLQEASHGNSLIVGAFFSSFNVRSIEDAMLSMVDTGKINLLCLDYINILSASDSTKTQHWEQQKIAIWELKDFCKKYNIACWTASQISDEAYDKELFTLKDAKYSRAVPEACSLILGIVCSPKDKIENTIKVQVLKSRMSSRPKQAWVLSPDMGTCRLQTKYFDLTDSTKRIYKGRRSTRLRVSE